MSDLPRTYRWVRLSEEEKTRAFEFLDRNVGTTIKDLVRELGLSYRKAGLAKFLWIKKVTNGKGPYHRPEFKGTAVHLPRRATP